MPNLEMTKKEKEDLVAKVTDAVFAGVLNRMDAIAILDICSQACSRESQKLDDEIEKIIGKPSDMIQ